MSRRSTRPASIALTPLDPRYPSRLRGLDDCPPELTVRGGPVEAAHAVAVVGSRRPLARSVAFTKRLCRALVDARVVIVSGGAFGVDAAAHQTALRCGGVTWAMTGTGPDRCYPQEHDRLFARIGRGPGAVLWPFPAGTYPRGTFLRRNRWLVALADAVVVVQAAAASGSLSAATEARSQGKPLWVVPAGPWDAGFDGSHALLAAGAQPLIDPAHLLAALEASSPAGPRVTSTGSTAPTALPPEPDERSSATHSPSEHAVLRATSNVPQHVDALAAQAGLGAQATAAALLTLVLENVVVEGPPGFFRRRKPLPSAEDSWKKH